MLDFITDILEYLERNPGLSVLVALIIIWRTGKDVLLPLVLPSIKSASQKSDVEGDMLQGLTSIITVQNTAIQDNLQKTETFMETLVKQQQKSNEYFEKIVFAGQQQLAQTEKWLGTIGEGFVGTLNQHEEQTSGRFENVQAFILQNTSELLAVKQALFDVKMALNDIAVKMYIPPPTGNDTEPITPVRATATLSTVTIEGTV